MANRNEKVTISGDASGLIASLKQAQNAVKDLVDQTKQQEQGSNVLAASQTTAWNKTASALATFGAVAGTAVVGATVAYASFSDRMAQVNSLQEVSSKQMQQLTNDALHLGTNFGLSANDVADAEIEMAKAGISVTDQLNGGLKGALSLAAAGQISVGDATSYATIAMTQFGLKGSDIPHLADLMAAGADKALGSVQDLGEALSNGGLQASSFGLSIEDTIGTLAMFAQNGLIGAEAGTQMKSMFQKLQNPTKESSDLMKKLGLSVYDSSGKFVGITKFAGELHDKLSGLTQAQQQSAMATIFGSYAINGATVLMKEGAKGTQEWINKVNDSGFAAKQAAGKMDSLAGDAKKFTSAVQTTFIKSGSSVNDLARGFVQLGTKAVNALGNMSESTLRAGMIGTASVAGLSLFTAGAMKAVTAIADFQKALGELQVSGKFGSMLTAGVKGFGTLAGILAGEVVVSLAAAAAAQKLNTMIENGGISVSTLAKRMEAGTNATKNFMSAFKNGLGNNIETFHNFGNNVGTVVDQLTKMQKIVNGANKFAAASGGASQLSGDYQKAAQAIEKWGDSMSVAFKKDAPAAQAQLRQLVAQQGLSNAQVDRLINNSGKYKSSLESAAKAAGMSTSAENLRNIALGTSEKYLESVSRAQNGYNKTQLEGASEALQWQQSLNDLDDAVKNNTHSLDSHTTAGNQNLQLLQAAASQTMDYAESQVKAGKSFDDVKATMDQGRQSIIDHAMALGASGDEAQRLADQYMSMSSMKDILKQVKIKGLDEASKDLNQVGLKVKQLPDGTLKISGDNKDALQKLAQVSGAKIDPKTGVITADDNQWRLIYALVQGAKIDPKTGYVYGDNTQYWRKWAEANGLQIDTKTGQIIGNDGALVATVNHANSQKVNDKWIKISADASSAYSTLDGLISHITSTTVPLKTTIKVPNANGGVWNANGNVLAYAGGGENHLAQIAPAGAWRVWAEPETGGEAYIPLSPAKRARSTMILADVANRFGYGLAKRFASGGLHAASPRQTVVIDRGETSSPQINVPISQTIVSRDPYVEATVWGRDLRRELGGLV